MMIEQRRTMDFIETSNIIYNHLSDELSKKIYISRLLYSLTGNVEFIRNMVKESLVDLSLVDCFNKKKTYIFGAGIWGKEIVRVWRDNVVAFLDNDPAKNQGGCTLEGIPIISPGCLIRDNDPKQVIIGTRLYYDEIRQQLIELGVSSNDILNVGALLDELAEKQYFDLTIMSKEKKEIFVDVGSFDGMSSLRFFNWNNNNESGAICFEPDSLNIPKCEVTLKNFILKGAVEIINKGAWSESAVLKFASKGNGASTTSKEFMGDSETTEINVTALDSVLEEREATYIKMDIEGAEYEALKGCKNTIRNKKPKLAICVYHKPEDIIELPKLILDYYPNYKLYLRHYSIAAAETVLYAIP